MDAIRAIAAGVLPSLFFCFSVVPLVIIAIYLFQTRTYSLGMKFLYLATLCIEAVGAVVRFFLSLFFLPVVLSVIFSLIAMPIGIVIYIMSFLRHWTTAQASGYFSATILVIFVPLFIVVAIIWTFIWSWWPIVMSFLNLMGWPSGIGLQIMFLGAYYRSKRQRDWYNDAIAHIKARATIPFSYPADVYMLQRTDDLLFTIGRKLFISEGLMRAPQFTTLLAAELYHYNSGEGRLNLALRRLCIDPLYLMARSVGLIAPGNVIGGLVGASGAADSYLIAAASWIVSALLAFAGGGIGILILSPFYATHARDATYKADAYAASLGYCTELLTYLDEKGRVPIVMPIPYFMSPDPFTEKRHERLSESCQGQTPPPKKRTTQPLNIS